MQVTLKNKNSYLPKERSDQKKNCLGEAKQGCHLGKNFNGVKQFSQLTGTTESIIPEDKPFTKLLCLFLSKKNPGGSRAAPGQRRRHRGEQKAAQLTPVFQPLEPGLLWPSQGSISPWNAGTDSELSPVLSPQRTVLKLGSSASLVPKNKAVTAEEKSKPNAGNHHGRL